MDVKDELLDSRQSVCVIKNPVSFRQNLIFVRIERH